MLLPLAFVLGWYGTSVQLLIQFCRVIVSDTICGVVDYGYGVFFLMLKLKASTIPRLALDGERDISNTAKQSNVNSNNIIKRI